MDKLFGIIIELFKSKGIESEKELIKKTINIIDENLIQNLDDFTKGLEKRCKD